MLITMNKESHEESNDCCAFHQAIDFYDARSYQRARRKFEAALSMAQKRGDQREVAVIYIWIIDCSGCLDEVSSTE